MPSSLSHGLSGSAGEYYVAAELCRLGYVATVTNRSAQGIDILAAKPGSRRAIKIQVKTTQGSKPRWLMNQKHEKDHGKNFFYVFVRLGTRGTRPDFHIAPGKAVASRVYFDHKLKAARPAARDSGVRCFRDEDGIFKEKWSVLERA